MTILHVWWVSLVLRSPQCLFSNLWLKNCLICEKNVLHFAHKNNRIRIRIRMDLKCLIQIRICIEFNTDPKHGFLHICDRRHNKVLKGVKPIFTSVPNQKPVLICYNLFVLINIRPLWHFPVNFILNLPVAPAVRNRCQKFSKERLTGFGTVLWLWLRLKPSYETYSLLFSQRLPVLHWTKSQFSKKSEDW